MVFGGSLVLPEFSKMFIGRFYRHRSQDLMMLVLIMLFASLGFIGRYETIGNQPIGVLSFIIKSGYIAYAGRLAVSWVKGVRSHLYYRLPLLMLLAVIDALMDLQLALLYVTAESLAGVYLISSVGLLTFYMLLFRGRVFITIGLAGAYLLIASVLLLFHSQSNVSQTNLLVVGISLIVYLVYLFQLWFSWGNSWQQHQYNQKLLLHRNHLMVDIKKANNKLTKQRGSLLELARQQRIDDVNQWGAAIVHEISQPISVIEGQLIVADTHVNNAETRTSALQKAKQTATQAREILAGMRGYISRKQQADTMADLSECIDNACLIVRASNDAYQSLNIGVRLAHDASLQINPAALVQVITNLLNNALDATQTSAMARIVIVTKQVGDCVFMRISNNGIPISTAQQDKLFTIGFSDKLDGVGLGLGLCRSLLNNVGGDVVIHCSHPSRTSFEILLPCAKAGQQ